MRSPAARTHHIHLHRAARIAGEAFAFDEPDSAPVASKSAARMSVLWVAVAVVAFSALYFIV